MEGDRGRGEKSSKNSIDMKMSMLDIEKVNFQELKKLRAEIHANPRVSQSNI